MPLEAIVGTTPLLPPLEAVAHLPRVAVTEAEVTTVGYGQAIHPAEVRRGPGAAVVAVVGRRSGWSRWRGSATSWFQPDVVLEAAG